MVSIGDWDKNTKKLLIEKTFHINNVRYLLTGKVCPHIKDNSVKKPNQAFTVIIEDGTTINFFAKDEKMACNWIDGFNILLGGLKIHIFNFF